MPSLPVHIPASRENTTFIIDIYHRHIHHYKCLLSYGSIAQNEDKIEKKTKKSETKTRTVKKFLGGQQSVFGRFSFCCAQLWLVGFVLCHAGVREILS